MAPAFKWTNFVWAGGNHDADPRPGRGGAGDCASAFSLAKYTKSVSLMFRSLRCPRRGVVPRRCLALAFASFIAMSQTLPRRLRRP